MPIILSFSAPVQDKAAVERSIELRTSKQVIGSWYWDGNQTLDFRPRDYWPAYTPRCRSPGTSTGSSPRRACTGTTR